MPISTAIAKVGSLQSCPAKGLDLNKLGAPRSKDPLIRTIKESHLLTTFKQMSARISLRNIDDNGVAQRAHVYSIDGDLSLLISWKTGCFLLVQRLNTWVRHLMKDQVFLRSLLIFC